jgi:transcriptional regulator with XRE-family HTH domain
MVTIGDRIKKVMRAKNITLAELTVITGLSRNTVKNFIYNRSQSSEGLQIIADSLEVPIAVFLQDTREKINNTLFGDVTLSVCRILEKHSIELPAEELSAITSLVYNKFKNREVSLEQLDFFVEGMLSATILKESLLVD